MVKVGKWIAKHRILMLIIGFLLIIPSVIGMAATKVNYDLLSYLPEHLETVKGQDILVDEYGMGAFSMVVVENMEMKDVQKLEEKFEQVNHVKEVLWYDDVADISVPVEMIPEKLRKAFYNGDATMMLVLFDNTTSSDDSMEAIEDLRKIANEQCFIGGMTGVVTDIKNVAFKRAAGLRCHRRSFEPRCHRADIDFLRCSDPVPVKYRTCNPLQPGKQRVPW